MKCPECDGTGKVVHPMMSMNGDEYTGEWEQHECEMCGGTGEVKTEHEWLQTATAEELAKFLSTIAYACMRCGMTNIKSYCYTNFCIQDKEDAMEWLKQPHKPIS